MKERFSEIAATVSEEFASKNCAFSNLTFMIYSLGDILKYFLNNTRNCVEL